VISGGVNHGIPVAVLRPVPIMTRKKKGFYLISAVAVRQLRIWLRKRRECP